MAKEAERQQKPVFIFQQKHTDYCDYLGDDEAAKSTPSGCGLGKEIT